MSSLRVEISVDTLAGALAADALGVDRIELCAAGVEGGLTPSPGMVAAVVGSCSRVHVMVRPRSGDFVYTAGEVDVMAADIAGAVASGAAGVVAGVLGAGGLVDRGALTALVAAAGDAEFTFHRAVDACADPVAAVEVLRSLGVRRVLTSGGAPTAVEGAGVIADMVRVGLVDVMACGGVRPGNVVDVVRLTGVRDVHAAPRQAVRGFRFSGVDFAGVGVPDGFDRFELDEDVVRQLCAYR